MPRTFTAKEREYIAQLATRNLYDNEEEDWEEPQQQPMPAKERMRRKRIRDKAETAVMDLMRADRAGIIEIKQLVAEHETAIDFLLLNEELDREDIFWRVIGEEPEQVDID